MNINNLPVEILEQIFQLLPVDDLKCASAVCFTWSQVAFSWPCMQNVQLKVAVSSFEDGVVPEVLETTGRRFRHVCLRVDRPIIDQPHRIELISEVLLKFGESLESLRFIWDVEDEMFDLNSMLTVLRYVPGLRELTVEDFIDRRDELAAVLPAITVDSLAGLERVKLPHSLMDNEQFNLAELAPNLLHLSAEFKGRYPWEAIWLLSGQLYSLSIRTETENNFQPLWQIDPSSLRRLRLSRLCCDLGDINDVKLDDARCFFFQCTAITVLKLELHVSLAVIRVIAENCSLLRELLVYDVDDGWQLLVILQRLERLTSLTVAEASFEGADSDIYQIRLPNLVELVLDAIYLEEPTKFFIVLDQIVPNLKFLQVSNYNRFDSDSYNLDILKSLFRAKLQSLDSLTLCDYTCAFPSHLLNYLNLLPKLQVLELAYCSLAPWSRSAIVPGIKKLIVDTPITNYQLRKLLNVFPLVSRIEVLQAEDISAYSLEELSRITSRCEFFIRESRSNE
ncbi:hypothetical protein pipiens_013371 [Culex pipiens pipiens]|uniref:F-box domain-containing protein n=1 Tax=Culex pipiens pipiens TaxID=38569 RepID=A0ABD1CYN5_CULPP